MTSGADTTTTSSDDTTSPPPPGAARTLGGRVEALGQGRWRAAGIVFPFLILFIVLTIASSSFATKANLLNILDQQSATLIIAAAGTLVLVSGGIDLSVGSVYGLSGVVAAEFALHNWPAGVAIIVGVLVGFAAGLINGVVATYFRISALIATLAMSFVLAGLGSLITQGNLLNLFTHQSFSQLTRTSIFTVNSSIWLMLIAVIALGLFLARSTIGRYMYAAGGNPEAARIAGVRVNLVRVISFALSGGAAGLAGVIDASRVLSAQSQDNSSLTFTVLAGIVVGGTSILGGEGAVWRTVVGVLFIALIGNGYDLLGLNPLYEQITLGVLMILAVGLDAFSRGRAA
jgi:ribose transport system permease protein